MADSLHLDGELMVTGGDSKGPRGGGGAGGSVYVQVGFYRLLYFGMEEIKKMSACVLVRFDVNGRNCQNVNPYPGGMVN